MRPLRLARFTGNAMCQVMMNNMQSVAAAKRAGKNGYRHSIILLGKAYSITECCEQTRLVKKPVSPRIEMKETKQRKPATSLAKGLN